MHALKKGIMTLTTLLTRIDKNWIIQELNYQQESNNKLQK